MTITFDPAKRLATLEARDLDFLDAEILFRGTTITVEDTRKDYGERRFRTMGYLGTRVVMIVWTPRGEATHVISMRKCNAKEQKAYQEQLA